MDILGIGIPELVFIALIVLVILGPKDMQKAARAMGEGLHKLFTSDIWRVLTMTNRELQTLPNKLAREASIRKVEQELQAEVNEIGNALAAKGESEAESPIIPSPEPPSVEYPAPTSETTRLNKGKTEDA